MATSSTQKGVLWWAANHRHHHRYSDTEDDLHSPSLRGFLWSHVGWILSDRYNETRVELIHDFHKYPELRWLNKYHVVPPVDTGRADVPDRRLGHAGVGLLHQHGDPVAQLVHHQFALAHFRHAAATRPPIPARTTLLLALLTMGEGWHNNHHHYMASARQGFFWWEVDITYYVLLRAFLVPHRVGFARSRLGTSCSTPCQPPPR